MQLDDLNIIYFIGIGGIGMSALARWFNQHGIRVEGYDRTPTALTRQLEAEGIAIHYEENVAALPEALFGEFAVAVYTPAVPDTHQELAHLRQAGVQVVKRSELLGVITANLFTVAVAGTHGKTTVASMVAHILKQANRDMVAFLGGVAANYQSNLVANRHLDDQVVAVVEADEYDRSFLALAPYIAVVTAADPDHLDIYGDQDTHRQAFQMFIGKVGLGGRLVIQRQAAEALLTGNEVLDVYPYGISGAPIRAENITVGDGVFAFTFKNDDLAIEDIQLAVPGYHNVENALAAIAVGLALRVPPETIKAAMGGYRGVRRRFEYILKTDKLAFIDDYAHHPVEIGEFLRSARALYPGRKILVVFQPHLYSRTQDFAQAFGESLSQADQVVLLDIYPAREAPMPGVDAGLVLAHVTVEKTWAKDQDTLIGILGDTDAQVVATLGAGDIDQWVGPIKSLLEGRAYAS